MPAQPRIQPSVSPPPPEGLQATDRQWHFARRQPLLHTCLQRVAFGGQFAGGDRGTARTQTRFVSGLRRHSRHRGLLRPVGNPNPRQNGRLLSLRVQRRVSRLRGVGGVCRGHACVNVLATTGQAPSADAYRPQHDRQMLTLTWRCVLPSYVTSRTILGIAGEDYAIIASDTRLSEDYSIHSRDSPKAYPL